MVPVPLLRPHAPHLFEAHKSHMKGKTRCWWCGEDPLYCEYHDREWGVPVHDDRKIFEMLPLEGFQAGLSWIIILRKLEDLPIVMDRHAPLPVVILTVQRIL